MHMCVFLSTKKGRPCPAAAPARTARLPREPQPAPRDTQAARPHLLRTAARWRAGARRGCGLVKPARAITSSAAIRARIRRPPERAASSRSWAWPELLHTRAETLRHTLRHRAGEGRGRTGGEGLLLRARRAFLCHTMSTQQDSRKPREDVRHGNGAGSDRPRGACTRRTRPPPRRCCRHPSAAGADRRTHRCRHHTPATAQEITPPVSRLRKGSLKVQKSRERSPYPRAAAA